MQLTNLIMPRKTKALSVRALCSVLAIFLTTHTFAQNNSPYSRYGLGNMVPNTNIINRGMGGISAAYADQLSINFNNPASYSSFYTLMEERSKKMAYGRVLLDVGMNIENRTLREPNTPQSFTSSDAYFSYLHVGIPLNKKWGLSFGISPLTRIGYKINKSELLHDPITDLGIDSALTQYSGNGGTFIPRIGTGFAIKNFSIGVNMGYLFGKKESSSQRSILNDSILYTAGKNTMSASFGDIYFNAGAQYKFKLTGTSSLSLGVTGNLQHDINATQDVYKESYATGATTADTIYRQQDVKGAITFPASYTAGVVYERQVGTTGIFTLGTDYIQTKWNDFRYFGAVDSVQDNWQVRVGSQYRPNAKTGSGYFSNVTYRAGFSFGPDYIHIGNQIPQYGISFGMGLPLANYNRLSPGQFTMINVALEYEKRGNNDNPLKENLFRLSLGFNFSDLWFSKRKYD